MFLKKDLVLYALKLSAKVSNLNFPHVKISNRAPDTYNEMALGVPDEIIIIATFQRRSFPRLLKVYKSVLDRLTTSKPSDYCVYARAELYIRLYAERAYTIIMASP